MLVLLQLNGTLRFIYDETVDLSAVGPVQILRVSQIEADRSARWHADLLPVAGPVLGPFALRSEALRAEVNWLMDQWLLNSD